MQVLNFKKWLESQGIDTDVFWENCKRKNQGWTDKLLTKRKKLKKLPPRQWIHSAFRWEKSLDRKCFAFYANLGRKWQIEVLNAEDKGIKIKFGFKD